MRTTLKAVVVMLLLGGGTDAAQKEKAPPPLPKKASEQLKKITGRITEVLGEVKESKGGFINTKLVATEVHFEPIESVVARKPIAAKVRWRSSLQESKIYPTKEDAEKAKEWLKPGKIAANPNAFTKPTMVIATYYYVNEMWELGDAEWGAASLSRGGKTPWSAAIGEVANPKKKE